MKLLLAAGALMFLSGCTTSPDPTTTTVDVDQIQDEVDAINECTDEWNVFVDEWNDLTLARDEAGEDSVIVDGESYEDYAEYAVAKGYPQTYEEHCPES
jgi:hypothetical protein